MGNFFKNVGISILFVVCLMAIFYKTTGNEEEFSLYSFVQYVSTNIKPFPQADLSFKLKSFLDLFDLVKKLISYPFEVIGVVIHNMAILLNGILPFSFEFVGAST